MGRVDRVEVIFLIVLVPSVILHEISHGVVASRFGDDTARRAGRLTLNPVAHIDPFGTLLLPAMLALSGAPFLFGYAKPVPVRVDRLRNPRLHSLLVSLAGPATNFALAAFCLLVYVTTRPEVDTTAWWVLALGTIGNIGLGIFNLIPMPPLDGSAVIEFVLPRRLLGSWYRLRRYSLLLVFALLLFGRGLLDPVFGWAVDVWTSVQ
jgi:Zn-dependent protease